MTLWTLAALLLLIGAMMVASMLPARTSPPTLIVLQAMEPQADSGPVALPLLLLIAAVAAAAILL